MALPAAAVPPASDDDTRRRYRAALGTFATGVTVVTARAPDGAPVGLTVNSFTSVSLDPPLVSWCLAERALSLPAFQAASHFAVNVLAVDQVDLVHHFAQRTLDKFAAVPFDGGLGGVPLLGGVAARFECRNTATFPGGDHVIFLGEVERYERFDVEPLVFQGGRYGRLAEA
jgi:flavin reductase (DIM6/NTAB) family NADH-FMN oxidoreductase RutF